MDPFTAAGLALGATSLAFQVFDGVRKGFEFFEIASHAEEQYAIFQVRLHMDYDRLKAWSEISGVSKGDESLYARSIKQNADTVFRVLCELKQLLKHLRKMEIRWAELEPAARTVGDDVYKHRNCKSSDLSECNTEVTGSQSAQDGYEKIMQIEQESIANDDPQRSSVVEWAKRTMRKLARGGNPSRLKWAARDAKSFDEKLASVTLLITYLHETLSDDQLRRLTERTGEFNLLLLQLTTSVEDIKILLQASHPRHQSTDYDNSSWHSAIANVTPCLDDRPRPINGSSGPVSLWEKAASLSLEICKHHETGPEAVCFAFDKIMMSGVDPKAARQVASLRESGESIWIEWRQYSLPIAASLEKVQNLVRLLQAAYRLGVAYIPQCLGYFDGHDRQFGLMFKVPEAGGLHKPRSLLQYLQGPNIALEVRIAIARRLACWLMYLMAVNWLHKGLRSASVLFFESAQLKETSPLWVTEYTYSRPAGGSTTMGPDQDQAERVPYVHPQYLLGGSGSGYKKSYDMYSLGIILIELGLWQPVAKIPSLKLSGRTAHGRPPTPSIRQMILNEECSILADLKVSMGTPYTEVTKACLTGVTAFGLEANCDEKDVTVAFRMQRGFIEKVVHVLNDIKV